MARRRLWIRSTAFSLCLVAAITAQTATPRVVRTPKDTLLARAESAKTAKDYATALALYRKALDRGNPAMQSTLLYGIAECQVGAGSAGDAIGSLNQAASAATDEYAGKALLKLGDIYHGRNEHALTIGAYRRYLSMPGQPDKDKLVWRIGRLYQDVLHDDAAAVSEFVTIVNEYPKSKFHRQALLAAARSFTALHDMSAALPYYRKLFDGGPFPKADSTAFVIADGCMDAHSYTDAAEFYGRAERCIFTRADSVRARTGAVCARIMAGQSADSAITTFQTRFGKDITESAAAFSFHEGLRLFEQKQYDDAAYRFADIPVKYPVSPRAAQADYYRTLCFLNRFQKDEALKLLTDFSARYPTSAYQPKALVEAGLIQLERNQTEAALKSFSSALARADADSSVRFDAAFNGAVAYQRMSRWKEAAVMFARVRDSFPSHVAWSTINIHIGFNLTQAGLFQQALAKYQRAAENSSPAEKPEIGYWMASTLARLGDTTQAIDEYLKVPQLYSDVGKWGVTAQLEAARLCEARRDLIKARVLYREIIRVDGETGDFGCQASQSLTRLNPNATRN